MNDSGSIITKNIQELICFIDNDFDSCKILLEQIIGDIVKNSKHAETFVSFINGQLSNSKTRNKGVVLLYIFLELPNSQEFIQENAIAWLNNSLKYCQNQVILDDDAFKVIKILLGLCYEIPELSKAVTSGILAKVIEQIIRIKYDKRNCIAALQCLETCLRVYSGPCINFKTQLEIFLLKLVDCDNSSKNIRYVGKCLHALQQIGGGGARAINHKQTWKTQQQSLCATIHLMMDQLFKSLTEFGHNQDDSASPLILPDLQDGDSIKLLSNRVVNLIIFLQEMLLGVYPTNKSVLPGTILNVITRGLSVTQKTLGNNILSDTVNLSGYLFVIHKYLLQLLQALIICVGGNLIPYATVINKLIINNLKNTLSKNQVRDSLNCELRLTAYQTLTLWITTTKSASSVNIFADLLMPILIADITPMKTEINLTVQNTNTKNMSKKARKKVQQEQIAQSNIAQKYSPIIKKTINSTNTYEIQICSAALKMLRIVVEFCGHFIKTTYHKQLQEFVIKTLLDLQRGISVNPYENTFCLAELYKTLTCLTINHHWNFPPPLQYAVYLLSKGQMDFNPSISTVCSTSLQSLNNFIHPVSATLNFPFETENFTKKSDLNHSENGDDTVESDTDLNNPDSNVEINGENSKTQTEKDNLIQNEPDENSSQTSSTSDTENLQYKNEKIVIIESITEIEEFEEDEMSEETERNTDEIVELEKMIDEEISKKVNGDKNEIINLVNEIENIISDDDVMETLVLESDTDSPTLQQLKNKRKPIPSTSKQGNDVIDIDDEEEDMCSAFVDVLNE